MVRFKTINYLVKHLKRGWIFGLLAALPAFCCFISFYKQLSPKAPARLHVSGGSISSWLLCVVSATHSGGDSTCLARPNIIWHYDFGQSHFCLCLFEFLHTCSFVCAFLPVILHVWMEQTDGLFMRVLMTVPCTGRLGTGMGLRSTI